MKIYILTYTNKTFFSRKKLHSGIDNAALTQFEILIGQGHDVRMFSAQTDLSEIYDNIDYFVNEKLPDPKKYGTINKKNIEKQIISNIKAFEPDIILSNYEFGSFYKQLMDLDIPIAYILHSMPGFWNDYMNANLLYEMLSNGNTLTCVSEYHKRGTIKYYKSKRKTWNFDLIDPDFVCFPQYSKNEQIQESDGVIRHVSAASKEKDTFLINIFLEDQNIPVETFTTLSFLTKNKSYLYINNALEKYSNDIKIDIDHSEIMKQISKSEICFVGNVPDTFTITSLEALSRGVPLIVKDKSGHPALEMIEPENHKYIKLIKTKSQFLEAINDLRNISFEERIKIAESTERITGKLTFIDKLNNVIFGTINKFNSSSRSKDEFQNW